MGQLSNYEKSDFSIFRDKVLWNLYDYTHRKLQILLQTHSITYTHLNLNNVLFVLHLFLEYVLPHPWLQQSLIPTDPRAFRSLPFQEYLK